MLTSSLRSLLLLGVLFTLPLQGADLPGLCYRPAGRPRLGNSLPEAVTEALPPTLSATGAFRDLVTLKPHESLVPYTVNTPLWSDGAEKLRFMMIPSTSGETIGWSDTGDWTFPAGSVFVKHFDLVTNEQTGAKRRLETRFIVKQTSGGIYGVTYKWNTAQTDANLVVDAGEDESIPVTKKDGSVQSQVWHFPSRANCLQCHNSSTSGILGVNTRQLNKAFHYPATQIRDNQLHTLAALGFFNGPTLPSLANIAQSSSMAALTDESASLETRARSYLDANCAHCHRPTAAGVYDGRFDTSFAQQGLAGTLRTIAGRPFDSRLHVRSSYPASAGGMPNLAKELLDPEWMQVLNRWIGGSFNPVEAVCESQLSRVTVRFNKRVSPASLSGALFSIPGYSLTAPQVQADGRSVQLTVTPVLSHGANLVLKVSGVGAEAAGSAASETCWPGITTPLKVLGLRNDGFGNAEPLPSANQVQWGPNDISTATTEINEPDHGSAGMNRSVWFTWKAPQSGSYAADTLGSDFATALGVYTGSTLDQLTSVGQNTSTPPFTQSRIKFTAMEGQEFYLAAAATLAGGTPRLQLHIFPDCDNFASAVPIQPGGLWLQMHDFTSQPSEPNHAGAAADDSAWLRWDAPASGDRRVTLLGDHPTKTIRLAVYTGNSLASLVNVSSGNGQTSFQATAATRYWIAVDRTGAGNSSELTFVQLHEMLPPQLDWIYPQPGGRVSTSSANYLSVSTKNQDLSVSNIAYYDGANFIGSTTAFSNQVVWLSNVNGPHTLRAVVVDTQGNEWSHSITVQASPPPTNDLVNNAQVLTGVDVAVTGSNALATASPEEALHGCSRAQHSVWFRWTPPASGRYIISTQGSNFDTTLAAFLNGGTFYLTSTQAGGDDALDLTSRVTVLANAGQEITLAIDGYSGAVGNYNLSIQPDLDAFEGARSLIPVVNGAFNSAYVTANNSAATGQPGEPDHGGTGASYAANNSLWFSWLAQSTAPITVSTAGSNFDTTLAVYTGTSLSTLTRVAFNDDEPNGRTSIVTFTPVNGQRYWIAVDGYVTAAGNVMLQVTQGGNLVVESMAKLNSGSLQIIGKGVPAEDIRLEYSENLQQWFTLAVRRTDANGSVIFTDSAASYLERRLYRLRRN